LNPTPPQPPGKVIEGPEVTEALVTVHRHAYHLDDKTDIHVMRSAALRLSTSKHHEPESVLLHWHAKGAPCEGFRHELFEPEVDASV